MTSECKHRSYQTVPMNGRKCNDCGRWLDDEETAMTSELRPALTVWADALEAFDMIYGGTDAHELAAAAVIEADREAVRAEQAAELAKFKALAETLAGALELADCALSGANMNMNVIERKVREALLQYKEAHDAS